MPIWAARWRKASDELPKGQGQYLVYVPGRYGVITMGWWDLDGLKWYVERYPQLNNKVTHWMPIHPPEAE